MGSCMRNKLNRGHNGMCIRKLRYNRVCSHLCCDCIHFRNMRCFIHHDAMIYYGLRITFCYKLRSAFPYGINCLSCISSIC